MPEKISHRLLEIVEALPLKDGVRVLEIGCGTGVTAREIANRIGKAKVLAIDRSAKMIAQAKRLSHSQINNGSLEFMQTNIEDFALPEKEQLYDFAFAVRVGALDGRHPELEQRALHNIARALRPNGKLFIDGGDPLKEINLVKARV